MYTVPIVVVRGSVVFPHTDSILTFGRTKSIDAINASFQDNRTVAIFTQKDPKLTDPKLGDLYRTGTIATITQMMTTDGDVHAMVQGKARIHLDKLVSEKPFLVGEVSEIVETENQGKEVLALTKQLEDLFRKAINLGKGVEVTTIMRILSQQITPVELVDSISSLLNMKTKEKQILLQTPSVKKRLKKVVDHLSREVNVLDLERVISTKTQKRFEDQMRKAMLREKKRTIEAELGEGRQDENGEMAEYKTKIKNAKMPKDINKKAKKELSRLKKMNPHNPEGGYIRNYLDWLTDMPWSIKASKQVSIKKAEKILNEDHYGINKAKERILESLSVMQLKEESKDDSNHPTILCFVGPPGVGKTSIGKSIARSLDRNFTRVSLGGIRDEAELRGHRRTYVGAMPGRIIQGIKNAGIKNPVFMLDEIDKLGADYRGDPSSALLEILDPEQNREFSDHYLEVPFDLSEVMFICTANVLDTIPLALRDRMEVINFPGYIEDEKFQIAKKYLWSKQLRVHGMKDRKIKISNDALYEIVKKYTREAGVRDLERNLARVARKIARRIAEKKRFPLNIEISDVKKFLGPEKFNSQIAGKEDEIGMSTGLSVTSVGGEILFVEVALTPGRGKLLLTGQLGNVMQESAKAAFTWTKSHWQSLGLKEGFAKEIDVHIHVPEGAIPKDGPSAGAALTTALVSALTSTPVRRDVGMTGEVTLRGRILEIGGVKEKVIAGHRAGLKKIILPKDNKKDLIDVPANVKRDIKFVFAENVDEVLKAAFDKWTTKKVNGSRSIPGPSFLASA